MRHRQTRLLHSLCCGLTVLTLASASTACALPKASGVPGGVAIVPLSPVSPQSPEPRAWLGEQRLWVTSHHGRWVAIVGLALDTPEGEQRIRVDTGNGDTYARFTVREKRYPEQHIALRDTRRITLSPEDTERALAEQVRVRELKRHWRESEDTSGLFVRPAEGRLSSRFGLRRFFNGEARAPHSGLDIAAARGSPVKTAAAGTVLAVDEYFFSGRTVIVDHGNGLLSLYGHLDRVDVRTGQKLADGDRLGTSGMSGRASGPHLHWSVVLNGATVDPELFLPSAPPPPRPKSTAR